MASIVVTCVDQPIDALGVSEFRHHLHLDADIGQAVGTDSAYCFGLCYFGTDLRKKSSCNFKFLSGNFVLEIGSIAGSIFKIAPTFI